MKEKKQFAMTKIKPWMLGIGALLIILILFLTFCRGLHKEKESTPIRNNEKRENILTGKGTETDPYVILSVEDFMNFAADVNNGNQYAGKYVRLETDMNMKSVADFQPIGSVEHGTGFSGIFNGEAHHIQNLKCHSENSAGIFDNLHGIVCNLILESGDLQGEVTGGIAGRANKDAVILNCYMGAKAEGETAGGIVGICEGTIVNCVNLAENGTDTITGDTETGTIWNCYTNKGGNFEIENHTSEAADNGNRERAVLNLNTMINELCQTYNIEDWYLWKLQGKNPVLSKERVNGLKEAVIRLANGEKKTASYQQEMHRWYFEIPESQREKESEVNLIFANGEQENFVWNAGDEEIVYTYQNSAYTFSCVSMESEEQIAEVEKQDETEVMLSDTQPIDNNTAVTAYRRAYISADDGTGDSLVCVKIGKPGTYRLHGKMTGEVSVDLGDTASTDGMAKAVLILDNVQITNAHGPAITIRNVLETDDAANPGVQIVLADDSKNVLTGSNSMNIYSADDKSEGVISTAMTMDITGNDGELVITGDLEGIESNQKLLLQGGTYRINSMDDGINTSKKLEILDGYFVMQTKDDIFDSNGELEIDGGMIVGGTPTEQVMNSDGNKVNGGTIIASSLFENSCKDSSKQGILNLQSEDMYEKGKKIVITDENDHAILAFEVLANGNSIVISMPNMLNNTYHFYVAADVEGNFVDGVCKRVDAYTVEQVFLQEKSSNFEVKTNCMNYMITME